MSHFVGLRTESYHLCKIKQYDDDKWRNKSKSPNKFDLLNCYCLWWHVSCLGLFIGCKIRCLDWGQFFANAKHPQWSDRDPQRTTYREVQLCNNTGVIVNSLIESSYWNIVMMYKSFGCLCQNVCHIVFLVIEFKKSDQQIKPDKFLWLCLIFFSAIWENKHNLNPMGRQRPSALSVVYSKEKISPH